MWGAAPQPANTGNRINPNHQNRFARCFARCKASEPDRMAKSRLSQKIILLCKGLFVIYSGGWGHVIEPIKGREGHKKFLYIVYTKAKEQVNDNR